MDDPALPALYVASLPRATRRDLLNTVLSEESELALKGSKNGEEGKKGKIHAPFTGGGGGLIRVARGRLER